MLTLMLVGVVLMGLFGSPLFLVIGGLAILLFPESKIPISSIVIEMDKLTEKAFFIPIPMFTFAGYVLAKSKSPKRIVDVVEAWFGWASGGLAIVALFTCAFFTTFTGASGVTIIAIGGLLFPILVKQKYPENFSIGMMTSGGSLGAVFFPCLPVFIYALVIESDPMYIFAAGLVPGMLSLIVLAVYAVFVAKKRRIPRSPFDLTRALRATKAAAGEVLLPLVLVFGIMTGQFTSFSAGTVTVVYVLMLVVVIFREVDPIKDLPAIAISSIKLVGAIFVIISMAMAMQNYLDTAQVPDKIIKTMEPILKNKVVFLLFLNGFLLVVGCMMDIFSAILTVVPLIAPLAKHFGVDPFHLAVIFLVNLEIGYLTPPVGINLFISSIQFRKPVVQVYKSVIPYIAMLVGTLLLITYVPALSMAPLDFYFKITGATRRGTKLSNKIDKGERTLDQQLEDIKKGKGKIDKEVDDGDIMKMMKKKPGPKKSPKDLLKQLQDKDDKDDDDGGELKPKAPPKKSPKDLLKQLDDKDDPEPTTPKKSPDTPKKAPDAPKKAPDAPKKAPDTLKKAPDAPKKTTAPTN
ncbi:MAG: TRAP transporter large permease subunit [Myxococcales bacterium]|nr:TRAP transporter large permease subunit [Myxococcales bacterium]